MARLPRHHSYLPPYFVKARTKKIKSRLLKASTSLCSALCYHHEQLHRLFHGSTTIPPILVPQISALIPSHWLLHTQRLCQKPLVGWTPAAPLSSTVCFRCCQGFNSPAATPVRFSARASLSPTNGPLQPQAYPSLPQCPH